MAIIKVTDANTYNKVKALIEKKLAPKNVALAGEGIRSGEDTFVLTEETDTQNPWEEKADSEAFTRFDILNPKTRPRKSTQTWETVLSSVLNYFYGNYSYLVYAPIKKPPNRHYHEDVIKQFLRLYIDDDSLRFAPDDDSDENYIYEVAVKFKMRLGGEPKPVLNRFYLRRDAYGKFHTLNASRCQNVYAQVMHALAPMDSSAEHTDAAPITLDEMLGVKDVLTELMTNDDGFSDYLVGEAKDIFGEYRRSLSGKGDDTDAQVLCDGAQIRYVARLLLPTHSYTVFDDNRQPLLQFTFDTSDAVSVVCPRCGARLVSENRLHLDELDKPLVFASFDDDKDFLLKNGLLSAEEESLVPQHFDLVQCTATAAGRPCRRYVCQTETFDCPDCHATLCAGCPYPEVVTRLQSDDESVQARHTSCLAFCRDTLSYLPKEQTGICSCCRERYTKASMGGKDYCGFCATVIEQTDVSLQQKYERHKTMLPYELRNKKNLCNENSQMILFSVFRGDGKPRKYIAYEKIIGNELTVRVQGEKK